MSLPLVAKSFCHATRINEKSSFGGHLVLLMKREVEFARTTKSLGWQKKGY